MSCLPLRSELPVTNGVGGQASHKPPGRKPRDVSASLKLPTGYGDLTCRVGQCAVSSAVRRLLGDGTTSSSDGQNFKAGGRGEFAGQINLRYGHELGVQFYTHLSDQYAPFHTKVINATVRDATHVLDGLLYHESDLRIEEHYTDTAGFTDHVFALMHLLGFRFAPRIRDLADKRLYIHGDANRYPTLARRIGGNINVKHIRVHWDEILRLAASIQHGTVTASLMLRQLGSYPRQNGLAVALRAERRTAPAGSVGTEQGRSQERIGQGRIPEPIGRTP